MIRSWKDRTSEQLWTQQKASSFRGLDQAAAIDRLLVLNVARSRDDLAALRSLDCRKDNKRSKVTRKKLWSMAIDDSWRIRFDWRNGDAFDVKIIARRRDESGDDA
jgi:proteic killer suppression protein